MDKKNENELNKHEQKPIVATVDPKTIATNKKLQEIENEEVITKNIEEHMSENVKGYKRKIDIKNILVYVVMVIIVVLCIFLLLRFCEKTKTGIFYEETTTTTTSNRFIKPTTTTTKKVGYATTSTVSTKSAYTVTTKRNAP